MSQSSSRQTSEDVVANAIAGVILVALAAGIVAIVAVVAKGAQEIARVYREHPDEPRLHQLKKYLFISWGAAGFFALFNTSDMLTLAAILGVGAPVVFTIAVVRIGQELYVPPPPLPPAGELDSYLQPFVDSLADVLPPAPASTVPLPVIAFAPRPFVSNGNRLHRPTSA